MSNLEFIKRDRQALVSELERCEAVFHGNACRCPYHDDKHASAGINQDVHLHPQAVGTYEPAGNPPCSDRQTGFIRP